ncbi:MAG: 2-hydroxyacid dehydrogenase [Alphaproteobacteria bacterium]|nr:2-hydroxyacid dehydrogenase [Alphaproteobacteria bacterium]
MTKPEIITLFRPMARHAAALAETFTVLSHPEAADKAAFLKAASHVRGLVTGGAAGVDRAIFEALPKLEIVSSFGVGYDAIDVKAAAARGVVVTNTPDVLSEEVADTAITLMLSAAKQTPQAERYLRRGDWAKKGAFPLATSVGGKTMGILGLGRIGLAIARRAEAMTMKVVYHNRSPRKDVSYRYHATLLDMAREVDVLMVITPGGKATDRIVDDAVIRALGPKGLLVNVARGSVVDQPALIRALQDGGLGNAALDVFADEPNVPAELIAIERVVLLPHVGSATVETRNAMGDLQVANIKAWFAGRPPLTPVPETPVPASRR